MSPDCRLPILPFPIRPWRSPSSFRAERGGKYRALDRGNHAALDGRWAYEIIYVNDGSTDATAERLAAIMKQRTNLRQLRHTTSSGQSAAVRSGVRAARGAIVATLDGDGQTIRRSCRIWWRRSRRAANGPALLPARGSGARYRVQENSSRAPPTPSATRSA